MWTKARKAIMKSLILNAAGSTHIGTSPKRKKNEDSYKILIPPAKSPYHLRGALFMVADGMGGIGGGDLASKSAVEEIIRTYYDQNTTYPSIEAGLRAALEAANRYLREQATRIGLPRIGTTLAGLVVHENHTGLIFNVGDSRVYRIRNGNAHLLSHDQSVVAEQLERGIITTEEARASENNNLTSFIGQPFSLDPVFRATDILTGDLFVICSDGLWRGLERDSDLVSITSGLEPQMAGRKLINFALGANTADNVTVVLVKVEAHKIRSNRWRVPLIGILISLMVICGIFYKSRLDENNIGNGSGDDQSAIASRSLTMPSLLIEASPNTITPTYTPTFTPSVTLSPSPSFTITASRTASTTYTATPTATFTTTLTSTTTPTSTETFTLTSSRTPTHTNSPTPSAIPSSTLTPTSSLLPTVTLNASLVTFTPSVTFTSTPPFISLQGLSFPTFQPWIKNLWIVR